MTWATFEDVTVRWVGPGAPTDEDLVNALISDAEQVILASYPGIQDRIDEESLPEARVTLVVTQMVSRVLRNPEGLTSWQQTTGPFSQARSYGAGSTGLYLTDDELRMLAPTTKGKAFEIDLGSRAVSPYDRLGAFEVDDDDAEWNVSLRY
jgi:hypothetical protein